MKKRTGHGQMLLTTVLGTKLSPSFYRMSGILPHQQSLAWIVKYLSSEHLCTGCTRDLAVKNSKPNDPGLNAPPPLIFYVTIRTVSSSQSYFPPLKQSVPRTVEYFYRIQHRIVSRNSNKSFYNMFLFCFITSWLMCLLSIINILRIKIKYHYP